MKPDFEKAIFCDPCLVPLAQSPYNGDMKLEFENGAVFENPSDATIAETLTSLGGENNTFAILSSSTWTYIQVAVGHDATCLLEYQEGSTEWHFQAETFVPLAQAIQAFQQYGHGDPAWKRTCDWRRITI